MSSFALQTEKPFPFGQKDAYTKSFWSFCLWSLQYPVPLLLSVSFYNTYQAGGQLKDGIYVCCIYGYTCIGEWNIEVVIGLLRALSIISVGRAIPSRFK